jgi:hypothetical protein
MFRSTPADAGAAPADDVMVPAELIPLSVLELDVDPPSVGGWRAFLAGRGVAVVVDNIGRDAVTRADARRLIADGVRVRPGSGRSGKRSSGRRLSSTRSGVHSCLLVSRQA